MGSSGVSEGESVPRARAGSTRPRPGPAGVEQEAGEQQEASAQRSPLGQAEPPGTGHPRPGGPGQCSSDGVPRGAGEPEGVPGCVQGGLAGVGLTRPPHWSPALRGAPVGPWHSVHPSGRIRAVGARTPGGRAGIGQTCTPASRREEPFPRHSHSSRPAQPPAWWLSVQQQHQRAPAGSPGPRTGPQTTRWRQPGAATSSAHLHGGQTGQVGPVRPPTHQSTPATDASSTVPSRLGGTSQPASAAAPS